MTTFVSLNREWRADGRFRSSEIVLDADMTMENIRGIVERLRLREGYTGAIHLTLIPSVSDDLVERAVELADRVRLNLEAPNQAEQSASAGEYQRRSLNEASCAIPHNIDSEAAQVLNSIDVRASSPPYLQRLYSSHP